MPWYSPKRLICIIVNSKKMVYYNTNPIGAYSNLQYAGSSLYNRGVRGINKPKKRVNIVIGRGILSSLAKTIGKRAVSAVKPGAKQLAHRGKQAAISQIGNLKQKAITSGKSLINKGKTAATSKLNELKNSVANKVKQKLSTAPEALVSKTTNSLKKLVGKVPTASKSPIVKPKRHASAATKSTRRSRRHRRRHRRRAARLGLARTVGMHAPVGIL